MTPLIIPFFIPHQGCPQRCIFCNQQSITSVSATDRPLTPDDIAEGIRCWLDRTKKGREVQVAFYGGSFTALARARQEELLGAVRPFVENGMVDSVRLSTRPDYINAEIADFLRSYQVKTVELGVQSLDNAVLAASSRGHTAGQVVTAFACLRRAGFVVGAQLMIGLPGETTGTALAGARRLAELRPDLVRIYPALVIAGSGLARLYERGKYKPLGLNKAVALCGRLKNIFAGAGIRVVRMGLQPSPGLEKELVAGPYHPAFGELVQARLLFLRIRRLLSTGKGKNELHLAAADESIFRGRGNMNSKRLAALGLLRGITVHFNRDQARDTVVLQ